MHAKVIFCRHCGAAGSRRFGRDARRRQRYHCPHCGRTFIGRTNTVKSGSRLSDREWELAARLFVTRGGMSGADLGRIFQCGRRTGQRVNRTFRLLVRGLVPRALPGVSEWDEAVVSKQWVLGGMSRTTRRCLLRCIGNRREDTLTHAILPVVGAEGLVFTDEFPGYNGLYRRMTVCHAREFVNSDARFVHTNSIEGVWGHMKELSRHVYRGFPKRTLPAFLAEFMFRYNYHRYEVRRTVLLALLSRKSINTLVV